MSDPDRDFMVHDREQEEWLRSRPVCSQCGERIQDEACHLVNDKYICNRCLDDSVVFLED